MIPTAIVPSSACEPDLQTQSRLLMSAPHAIISTDPAGRITSWNRSAEALYGWTSAEAIGQDVESLLLQGEGSARAATGPAEMLYPAEAGQRERLLLRKDGEGIWVAIATAPVRDADGVIRHIVGTSTDISMRRRLEEHLWQARRMEAVGRLAGGMAHDFNNLLTLIKGHSELLSRVLPAEGESREDIDQIARAADQAAGLIRRLLAFSRQEIQDTAREAGEVAEVETALESDSTSTGYVAGFPGAAAPGGDFQDALPAAAKRCILLVEDQQEVRALASRILAEQGYGVIEATDGLDALGILRSQDHRIDLVLTDAVMPRIDGPELIRLLRSDWPDLPVVMVSAYTDHDLAFKCAAELKVPFLYKPYRAEELLRTLRAALGG